MRKRLHKKNKFYDFRKAMALEIQQNKRSFIVYNILRLLVIVTMVRMFIMQNYESFFLCILTLVLLSIPTALQIYFKVKISSTLEIITMCFIFAAEILGEVNSYYIRIPCWDTMLHTLNGFLCAAVGFSLVMLLNSNQKLVFELSPFYICLVSFCFSMTIGVLWEFFEFAMDMIFHLDMQKDTVVTTISSVMLNPDGMQIPTAISGITSTSVNGQELPVNGYLDIGLIDTMEDLFVNLIGAAVFSAIGFLALKGNEREKKFVMHFTMQKKR